MKKGLVEIICVLDRSGSMGMMKKEAIGAFNKFLEDQQKAPGEALMTLTLFDHEYEIVHQGKDIKDVPFLTDETFQPRGLTALFDAVGRTVDAVGDRLAKTHESNRPEKVLFVILTDGQENSSKEYNIHNIKERIALQTNKYAWDFVFLGAGIDKMQAQAMGIAAGNTVCYAKGDHGSTVDALSIATRGYRAGGDLKL